MLHPQGPSSHDVGCLRSLNCLTLFPWFMKADIAMSWFNSFECTINAFQYRIASFKGLFHSSSARRVFAAIDNVKFSFIEDWPIFFCNFHHKIFRCHTNPLPVKFWVVHNIIHLPQYTIFFSCSSIHTLGPFVTFVNVHVKREIPGQQPFVFSQIPGISFHVRRLSFFRRGATVSVELTSGPSVSPDDSICE